MLPGSLAILIPSFFILARSVEGFMPRTSAAPPGPPMRPPGRSRTWEMYLRWRSSMVGLSAKEETSAGPESAGRFRLSLFPEDSMAVRSITFFSSRTFPGHG